MKIQQLIAGLVKAGLKPEWAKKIVSDSINHIIQNDVESIDTIDGYIDTTVLCEGAATFTTVVITYELKEIVCKLTYPVSGYHLS